MHQATCRPLRLIDGSVRHNVRVMSNFLYLVVLERYSVPFFFDPHVSTEVAPLPGTGTPKFESLNFGSFLMNELEAGYDAHQPKQLV